MRITADTNVLPRAILDDDVAINHPAAEAGLSLLETGGDTFVSFDKKAVKLLAAQGRAAQLLT